MHDLGSINGESEKAVNNNKIYNKTGNVLSLARDIRQKTRTMSLVKKKLMDRLPK